MDLKEKEEIRRIARDETRREYKRLKEKEKDKKERDTHELMKKYKDAVFHMKNISTSEDCPAAGISGFYIDSLENANTNTRIIIRNIDRALAEIERRKKDTGRQYEYEAFRMHYIDGMPYEKATEKIEKKTGEHQAPSTLKRWCDGIIKELSVLLWGI